MQSLSAVVDAASLSAANKESPRESAWNVHGESSMRRMGEGRKPAPLAVARRCRASRVAVWTA
eukprot:9479957-Pyramimonas_sp.AAC.1